MFCYILDIGILTQHVINWSFWRDRSHFICTNIFTHYNMDGVAVTMVIPIVHEKSCIDLHNAHGNLKNMKKLSHSHISQSEWWNCGVIIDTDFLNCFNYTTQLFQLYDAVISYTTNHNVYFNYYQIVGNYRHIICKTNLSNRSPFIHISVHSLCRISTTGISMTSQRRCHARDSQNHA